MMRTRLGSYVFGSFCSPITSAALRLVTRIRSGWPWTFLAPPARTHPPAKYAAASDLKEMVVLGYSRGSLK
ncbi:hypothetical protein PAHAL_3G286700 [Panicum hallii]|uniref:Uncharacterized protein n=1 Tax=Panicum hallii TaxID=206008 RepID=A0A2S3HC72_9POAL|nr:hypothetical protein PAHAL_3G286700 [Panicum hallii]